MLPYLRVPDSGKGRQAAEKTAGSLKKYLLNISAIQ